ncbi:Regulator of chromosome condensation (RCC1) repeat protein [Actinomadura rubteroloni]|uniref:Regulator of chromosome condensation (RCC1) repeat protein n=1 Tax=Actinomadura rubteroloni TaxID=1926885 RepID=A0A2P4ULB9_9ACTN|nr:RCC1 domain-containing protein [Actinomadura rubteroloni]POM25840.1 Regulator of chromosome condensation (RCC1) repeat protein [Actinomadura rubteroloni]
MVEQVVKGKRRTVWRAGLAAIVATAATVSGIAASASALTPTPWGNPVPGGAAVGYQFSLVTTAPDATGFNEVYATGENSDGKLGNGTYTDSNVFVKVKGLTRVKMVDSGWTSSVAVKQDGTVWTWGTNLNDDLGLGLDPEATVNVPTQVPGITNAVSASMGIGGTVVVVLADGTAKAWGAKTGNCAASSTPVTVAGLTGLATTPGAVAVGSYHVLALKADGTVKAWGSNGSGQLGTGNTTASCSPVTVPGLSGVTQVSAGEMQSVALTSSGSVKAWGANGSGQLGDGTTTGRLSPITVPGLTNVVGISAALRYTTAVTSAAAPANNRFAWGAGALGTGTNTNPSSPTPLAGENFNNTVITAGPDHALSVQPGAVPRAWGRNEWGALGTGDDIDHPTPTYVQRVG